MSDYLCNISYILNDINVSRTLVALTLFFELIYSEVSFKNYTKSGFSNLQLALRILFSQKHNYG